MCPPAADCVWRRSRRSAVERPLASIPLPDGSTEIDVLIEDVISSTVFLGELKWIRKPAKALERISREEDLFKGVHQLELIRDYGRQHPNFLLDRGKLSKPLDAYDKVGDT
jgi:hypothetical protein